MGKLRCEIHGDQIGGPMTCRHLSQDIWHAESLRPLRMYRGDFFDDAEWVADVALCLECVARFSITDQGSLNSVTLKTVDPVPVCPKCWLTLSASASGRS